jgi:NO-binding membrane sensor protein with MHYT domain
MTFVIKYIYNTEYVVLSFVVSFLGCFTSLEIINLRTSQGGKRNLLLLISSSVVMGTIAIFCMHFLGMMAVQLEGVPQTCFSTIYTFVSLVIATSGTAAAFWALGDPELFSRKRVFASSLCQTVSVISMHHIGMLSLPDAIDVSFEFGHYVAAILVCFIFSAAILTLYFSDRKEWNLWLWKRVICAAWLAASLSATHYIAALGASYHSDTNKTFATTDEFLSRLNEQLTADSTCLLSQSLAEMLFAFCMMCCLVLLVFVMCRWRQHMRARRALNAVSISAMYFNEEGHILVDVNGELPTVPIVPEYDPFGQSSLSPNSVIFSWIMRISHCWANAESCYASIALDGFIPSNIPRHSEYEAYFMVKFLQAVKELSKELRMNVSQIGVVYQDVLATKDYATCSGTALLVTKWVCPDAAAYLNQTFRWISPALLSKQVAKKYTLPEEKVSTMLTEIQNSSLVSALGVHDTIAQGTYFMFVAHKTSHNDTYIAACKKQPFLTPYAFLGDELVDDMAGDVRAWVEKVLLKSKLSLKQVKQEAQTTIAMGVSTKLRAMAQSLLLTLEDILLFSSGFGDARFVDLRSSNALNEKVGTPYCVVHSPKDGLKFNFIVFTHHLAPEEEKLHPLHSGAPFHFCKYDFFEAGHYFHIAPELYVGLIHKKLEEDFAKFFALEKGGARGAEVIIEAGLKKRRWSVVDSHFLSSMKDVRWIHIVLNHSQTIQQLTTFRRFSLRPPVTT